MDRELLDELFGGMDEALKNFSDAELDALVEEMGVADAMAHVMFTGLEGKRIQGLKEELDEMSQGNGLSDKVNDFINYGRAKLVSDTGVTMQTAREDRLGVNMDIVMSQFDLGFSREDSKAFIEGVRGMLVEDEMESVGDFIMRTPEEYLKLIVYYLGVRRVSDLQTIFTSLDNNKEGISDSRRMQYFGDRFYGYFSEALRAPTEFFCAMSPARLEYILESFQVQSVEDFNLLFIETHFMYALLVSVNPALLDYFREVNDIGNVEGLIAFVGDEEGREAFVDISNYGNGYTHNVVRMLAYFREESIDDLKKYNTGMSFLKKVQPKNLQVLLDIFVPESFQQLQEEILNDHIKNTIQDSDYVVLMEMLKSLGGEIDNEVVRKLISEKYTSSLSRKIVQLQRTLSELGKSKGNINEYVYHMFQTSSDIDGSIDELIKLLERLGESMLQGAYKYIDFSRLNRLSEFMGGTITSYLAHEVLHSSDTDFLYEEWEQVLGSFSEGSFDASSELHINLEYKNFQRLSGNEQISKHMREKFNFDSYTSIFRHDGPRNKFYKDERFELECVAYEAGLLRDYIFQVNEKAKELGKRVLVIPNLSYGYLPVTAIVDDLEGDDNIDLLMGVKVGSTESHNDREVLNAGLLKGSRGKIMNEQPIIIVVDGTNHLIARDGNGKGARYPDSYQGYLNQVIAMNHANGMDNKDKANYSRNGKTPRDIERLFESEEFQRLSEIYKGVRDSKGFHYDFKLWNTAGKDLIIRGGREELSTINNFSAEDISGPTMVFCNVGVLDEQLPDDIRREDMKHRPAYFDDSGRIIDFEYSFDNTGVHAVNSIEVALREITGASSNAISKDVASIIRYAQASGARE